jgi:hypothetical protein
MDALIERSNQQLEDRVFDCAGHHSGRPASVSVLIFRDPA